MKNISTTTDSKLNVQYYVICVIDLLDQSKRLSGWSELPESGERPPELIRAIKDTFGAVIWFKNTFANQFKLLGNINLPPDQWAQLNEEQKQLFHRYKSTQLSLQQFSDTFVFYAPLRNTHGDVSPSPIYQIIAACSMAMIASLAAGMPLRGGVCIGTGLELEAGNFYGPGLASAHYLESRIAQWPRIVVAKEILDFARTNKGFSQVNVINSCLSVLANHLLSLIHQDADGQYIVDFMGPGVRQISGEDEKTVHEAIHLAYDFVVSERKRFTNTNDKLADRYQRLNEYMQTRLSLWQL